LSDVIPDDTGVGRMGFIESSRLSQGHSGYWPTAAAPTAHTNLVRRGGLICRRSWLTC